MKDETAEKTNDAEITKEQKITDIKNYMATEGIDIAELTAFATGQQETTTNPEVRPADIEGGTNNVCMTNTELTAAFADLKRRFDALNSEDHGGRY